MYAIWHEFNLDVTPLLKMNAACMKRINEIQGNKSLNKKKKKKISSEVYKCKHTWLKALSSSPWDISGHFQI